MKWRFRLEIKTKTRCRAIQLQPRALVGCKISTRHHFQIDAHKPELYYVRGMVDSEHKAQVWNAVIQAAQKRLDDARERFSVLQQSLESEGKSTAGDKHETGRAMVQQEMERAAAEVNQTEEQLRNVMRPLPEPTDSAQWGSWVVLDASEVVIAAALGTVELPWGRIHVISPASPLAQALLQARAQAGSELNVNGRTMRVKAVR